MELFRDLPDRSNSDSSLRMGFWGSSKSILPSSVAPMIMIFTALGVARLLVFRAVKDRGGVRIGKFKCHKDHLTEI